MARVPRGSVKILRVVEAPAKLTYPPMTSADWAAPISRNRIIRGAELEPL